MRAHRFGEFAYPQARGPRPRSRDRCELRRAEGSRNDRDREAGAWLFEVGAVVGGSAADGVGAGLGGGPAKDPVVTTAGWVPGLAVVGGYVHAADASVAVA